MNLKIRYSNLDKSSLVGKFFHEWKNGEISRQGQILEQINANHFLVCFFEWFTGCESDEELLDFNEIINFTFYNSDYEMRFAYAKHRNDWTSFKKQEEIIQSLRQPLCDNYRFTANRKPLDLKVSKIETGILDCLKDGRKTQTDISNYFKKHEKSSDIRAALENLSAKGKVCFEEKKEPGKIRPITYWFLKEMITPNKKGSKMQNRATIISKDIMVEKIEIPEETKIISRVAAELLKIETDLKNKKEQKAIIDTEIEKLEIKKQKIDTSLATLRELLS